VSPGDTVTITCKASTGWLTTWPGTKEKGQAPKPLIYYTSNRYTGTPERFSGSGSGTDFTLTISRVEVEDAAHYYCQQGYSFPLTHFGGGTKVELKRDDSTPSAFIFKPPEELVKEGKPTAVCLINNFYPRDMKVTWKVDNQVVSGSDILNSEFTQATDNTYSQSSMLTLTKDKWEKSELYACEVTHKTLSSPLIKSFKKSEC
ncbi:hypothetical protein GDO86_000097, partial [Hymenochirus boettgeri]